MEYSTDSSLSFEELFGDVEHKPQADYGYIYGIDSEAVQSGVPRTYAEIVGHDNIACSISGGADSDIMLDIVSRLDSKKKVHYVFFDTGIEMRATLKHLDYLENRYGITIERVKAKVPVGAGVKKYGYPFMTKDFSEMIMRLQNHGFKWEDKPYDELVKEYHGCESALKWWCNKKAGSQNIDAKPYLKEFMVKNPPKIPISQRCCMGAKKNPSKNYEKENGTDITFLGIRKSEGGSRASAYKSCFHDDGERVMHFPLFWFKDEDKQAYEDACGIVHSDAYTVYGCKRTGCAGRPFASGFEDELKMLEKYEPQLYKAVCNIFGPAYEYTRAYRAFRDQKKKEAQEAKEKAEREESGQLSMFDD